MTHTITIPDWTPPTTNQWYSKHWRVRYKLSREVKDMIAAYAHKQDMPKATGKRAVRLKVWGWPKGKMPDLDAFDKLTLDALVACGQLLDDDQWSLAGRMQVEVTRSKERRTVIELTDI